MASYVVMEPPARGSEDAVIVRDGFHIFAFILPVVWLLVHRLWIEALAVFAATLVIAAVGSYFATGTVATVASLALGVVVGLEGAALQLAALRRKGWRDWGVVEAERAIDAEIRYLTEVGTMEDDVARQPVNFHDNSAPGARRDQPVAGPALGLLAYPVKG